VKDESKGTAEFRRGVLAEAEELHYGTQELEHRLRVAQETVANLKIIAEQSVGLDLLGERIASLACALRLLRELEQERTWPKDAA
jgi:hypothetical protein